MHCKHCGLQIDDDSKFCTSCGGKVGVSDGISQSQQFSTPIKNQTNHLTIDEPKYDFNKISSAFLVIALVDFGYNLLWTIISLYARFTEDYGVYEKVSPVTKPLVIINTGIVLFLCFLFTKNKGHKTFFLILAICNIIYSIYETYRF
jgi:hypothetical protein